MFVNIPTGHNARNEHDSAFFAHRNELAEARHHAMMLALGAHQPKAHPPVRRRPHRGMLPDVDLSNVVVDPSYRPLFGRIAALIGRLAGRLGATRPAAGTMPGGNS
ncbi:hypothetical protein N7E70_011375 [Aminobacter sp. NyZ550]|jgi:hypothetical protein|uniref:hypothetical protein n=1 Tax=unclassified Aminobacter TaxID=2644704 RepID=UPI0021D5BD8A|nr:MULTISPECIES: hypothetical protein [unclassified Aminobacter]WAX97405.1 hypothetical protein N7E70_011375 [Aminobacter sp. NyZ550]BBD39159.1 hypothetical protein Amn_40390 [Aminobacter sp. SS-2016]